MSQETMTEQVKIMVRERFETAAHAGYVSYGLSMTDGYYAPEPKSVTIDDLHHAVPVTSDHFRYNTDFRPTPEEIVEYNATFYVGTDYRAASLTVAIRWERGWKTYTVTGTRHAGNLIRKMAQRDGFQGARLNAPLITSEGYMIDNVISFDADDVTGSDRHGKFAALFDRNNAQYDLTRN